MNIIMTLALSITSAFIAAILTHYLATNRMRKDALSKFKLIAYSDFLSAASRLAVSRRLGNTENEIDDLAKLNDAKNRILVSGDIYIVNALVKFWDRGSTLEKESELQAFRHLLQLIRESLRYKKNDILSSEIAETLFKLEPSSYSFRAEHGKI